MPDAPKFTVQNVLVPKHDCDIELVFPGGKRLTVQCRPSNDADVNYNGSLDILLPDHTCVTCWQGRDMQAAPQAGKGRPHERMSDQLVMELPGDYD